MTRTGDGLARTPALERLLARTRASLVRQVVAYGVGTVLGAATLWLVFAFLADWGLRVPHPIRVFHGLVLVAVVLVFLWRDLLRPLRRLPGREGLALLFERAHPELRDLLISAVQFQQRGTPEQADPALVDDVVRAAEARAATLEPRSVIDPEAPRARFLLGLGGAATLAVLASFQGLHARTFLARLLGGRTPWPQRTHLVVEIPGLEPETVVERSPERLRLRLARGSDVALVVTAEGEVPDEVRVHFDGGRDVVLVPSGGQVFRTLLRSLQEDLAFHVTGGDDEDGLPRVEIEVLEPPDVEGLALAVEPPAYSGLQPALFWNQDIEVLAGSHLAVHVLPAPRTASGKVRFLPDDVTAELLAAPFPAKGDETPEPGLLFERTANQTLGFRIELVDENGLSNPEPGLYRVRVIEDRAPELAVLAPTRGEFETVRGGAIPLRVRAEDDFALAAMGWRVSGVDAAREDAPPLAGAELVPKRPTIEEPRAARGARITRDVALGGARLEVDALGTEAAPVAVDSRFELEFWARDRRAPEANEGRSAPIRIRVVTPEELLRRLQDRLAQARMDALRLSDEQRARRARIEELLDAIDGDAPLATGDSLALSAALAGERRVLADAQALARALAAAAEDVLYARLDEKAAALLDYYDGLASQAFDARFQSDPWRQLAAATTSGTLPDDGFAARLVRLVGMALEISEDHATRAVTALDDAEEATTRAAVADLLQRSAEHAAEVERSLERLLAELAEWDNFQNVLTLTRDILNRQKTLRERTQQFGSEK